MLSIKIINRLIILWQSTAFGLLIAARARRRRSRVLFGATFIISGCAGVPRALLRLEDWPPLPFLRGISDWERAR